jgi:hypothetical protein
MKKRCWLHFVGKKYYSIKKFKQEALQYGISRAVSQNIFKKMKIGDTILLAQKDGKSTKIFGCFIFTRIVGLSEEATQSLKAKGIIKPDNLNLGQIVSRGCGSYQIQATYQITDGGEMMKAISEMDKSKVGKVMIGGEFHPLSFLGIDTDYLLSDIPFQMGFRRINLEALKKQFKEKKYKLSQGYDVKLKGQFYPDDEGGDVESITSPSLYSIKNYKLN